ncbi:MAG: outer membrane lipoprotein carrier protein LolA [Nitrospirae bacterium]|nr:outer membrane lipoprotein carrier protein LolA [Nitrospirota bacterium]
MYKTVIGELRLVLSAFALFFLLFLQLDCYSDESSPDKYVKMIQKSYDGIKDISGTFAQKNHIKDLKRTDTYRGNFFIKPPKMKWEYIGERPQSVYITTSEIIIYQKKEKQAFRAGVDNSIYGRLPLALLGGFGRIKEEFDITLKAEKRLLLKPQKGMGDIISIEIEVGENEFPIESLVIIDRLQNRISIVLKDVKINTGLKDRIFEFSPPEDVVVIKQ